MVQRLLGMILLTTSRRPTRGIRTLCHDLHRSIPGLRRLNRGKMSLHEVGEKATELGADKIVVIDRWRSGFGRIRFLKANGRVSQVPPCIYIRSTKPQREFDAPRKPSQLLLIDGTNVKNPQAESLREGLSNFLGLPLMEAHGAPPEYRAAMRLEVDSSRAIRLSFYVLPENAEIGPRITVSHVEWEI